jgi:tetratricopeptide (TPR) repeat protein
MLTAVLTLMLAVPAPPQDFPDDVARKRALARYRVGEELMRSERFDDAAGAFRQAVAIDPLLVIAHYNLGQAYMALKRPAEAAIAYRGCQQSIERINNLGQKEREQRERDNLEELQELRSSLTQVRTGKLKALQANPEPMIARIEERIRVLENMRLSGREMIRVPAEVHLALGSAYFRQDKLQEAEGAYTAAVRENDKLGAAHNNLAVIYMLTGRFTESHTAVRAAERAGFRVDPRLKADLQAREAAAPPR